MPYTTSVLPLIFRRVVTMRHVQLPFPSFPTGRTLHLRAVMTRAALLALGSLLAGGVSGCAMTPTTQDHRPAVHTTPSSAATTPSGATVPTPHHYTTRLVMRQGSPDDLALDPQGRLLVSDVQAGTISRVESNGAVTLLLQGLAGPEGLVVLADGSLVIAEQGTNRLLLLAPGAATPRVLRALPGTPSAASCKEGVDGIGFDPKSGALIAPDSPIGAVYRLSVDGQSLVQIAAGLARPVGAAADGHGAIYVADECGGAIWRLPVSGAPQRIGGFSAPDDVAFDPQGNLLITDLGASAHALVRLDPVSGQRETLAQAGLGEPQGLLVDARGDIFLADEALHQVIEYVPVG
jgi:sugar lactone lactonase YvrE